MKHSKVSRLGLVGIMVLVLLLPVLSYAGTSMTRGEVLVVGDLVKLGAAGAAFKTTLTTDLPLGVVTHINVRGVAAKVNIVNTDEAFISADEAITAGEYIGPSGGTAGTVVGEGTMQDNSFGIAVADAAGGLVKTRFVTLNPDTDDAPYDAQFVTAQAEGDLTAEVVVDSEASLESLAGAIDIVVATELLGSSAGAGDSGKPIKLDADGHVDASMINSADVSLQLSDLTDVGVTTPTDKNFLKADGDSWEAGTAAAADISDFDTEVGNNTTVAANTTHKSSSGIDHSLLGIANGTIVEAIDIDVIVDTGVAYLTLEKDGTGDITANFSDGPHTIDCTDPIADVALTAGADDAPTLNYVYILESNDTLTASDVGWPTNVEHARVATVLVETAATVDTNEPYAVQAYRSMITDVADDMGHLIHIDNWIRDQYATWVSGVGPTLTITVVGGSDTVIFTSASGVVDRIHPQTFPAFTGTPDIYVINDFTTPYTILTDLNQLDATSDGTPLANNNYFTIVIWGVISEDTDQCKLMLNLPAGVYGSVNTALADSFKYTNFDIPATHRGVGFLIASYTLKYATADSGTFTLVADGATDLRGKVPSVIAGGGTIGAVEFSDNVFRINDEADSTKKIAFQASAITTATVRTITVPDANVILHKEKVDGTEAPDADNDIDEGYSVGSLWQDVTNDQSFVCLDITVGAAVWIEITAGAAGGETNTASNQGADGVGVYDAKAGVDLQLRNIAPASAKITVALNGKDIDLDVAEAEFTVAILGTLMDAKGDIITATADDTPARLAVGTDTYALVADSGEATGLNYVPNAYVDRGDVAAVDWTIATLTEDGNWHDLDLSGILPAGAVAVHLRIVLVDETPANLVSFRKNGNANLENASTLYVQAANIAYDNSTTVTCDANRVIEYLATNTTWTTINLTVRGWWF